MVYQILCDSLQAADYVYDVLVTETSGSRCLCGHKKCIDEHLSVPDVMEFELTEEEAKEVKQLPGVLSVRHPIGEYELCPVTIITSTGQVKAAEAFTSLTNVFPHSLFYHTNFELSFNQNDATSGTQTITLSNIDCSNVDFVVMDSGIDTTHPDLRDRNGNSRVVQFDWTLLRESPTGQPYSPTTGNRIVTTLPANYNRDRNGHGTSVASLAAGTRCGLAKEAKIYSLRCIDSGTEGLDGGASTGVTTGMKLLLAFQKAKKQNAHGLNSSRPTISVNSWGFFSPPFLSNANNATATFASTTGTSYNNVDGKNRVATMTTTIDAYVREFLSEGGHFVVAAGNDNQYLVDDMTRVCSVLYYQRVSDNKYFLVINDNTTNSLQNNQIVTIGGIQYKMVGRDNEFEYSYHSPDVGRGFGGAGKNTFPAITVGDIMSIGTSVPANQAFDNSPRNVYTLFQNASDTSARNVLAPNNPNNVRYKTPKSPFFAKSTYSNFGPGVDIYATGNHTWSAASKDLDSPPPDNNMFVRSANEKYKFMNGTSAACPVVAGCLGTFLSEFPTATPREARDWLVQSGINGNIAETRRTTLTVNHVNANTGLPQPLVQVYGPSSPSAITNNADARISERTTNPTATLEDFSYCCRFFDCNNILAQAYPLRKGVFDTSVNSFNRFNTTLRLSAVTELPKTHDLPLF